MFQKKYDGRILLNFILDKNIMTSDKEYMPEDLLLAKEVKVEDLDERRCRLSISPLESGFGVTIGNALRRVLLSYIPGYAIYAIRINGVKHEYSTVDGVVEDVIQIVLNLKKVILRKKNINVASGNAKDVTDDGSINSEKICIKKNKGGVFVGKDITDNSKYFEVVNSDLVICNFAKEIDFEITIDINKGVGFKVAKEFNNNEDEIGTIYIDSIYAPIINVAYNVDEKFHLNGEDRLYDSLTMEITSNGAIEASRAVCIAAKILIQHLKLFLKDQNFIKNIDEDIIPDIDANSLKKKELLDTPIADLPNGVLSKRARNSFTKSGMVTVRDMVEYISKIGTDPYLKKIKSCGETTKDEVRAFVEKEFLWPNGKNE